MLREKGTLVHLGGRTSQGSLGLAGDLTFFNFISHYVYLAVPQYSCYWIILGDRIKAGIVTVREYCGLLGTVDMHLFPFGNINVVQRPVRVIREICFQIEISGNESKFHEAGDRKNIFASYSPHDNQLVNEIRSQFAVNVTAGL